MNNEELKTARLGIVGAVIVICFCAWMMRGCQDSQSQGTAKYQDGFSDGLMKGTGK